MAARHPHAANPYRAPIGDRPEGGDPSMEASRNDLDAAKPRVQRVPRELRPHPYRRPLLLAAVMAAVIALVWAASDESLRAAASALDWMREHDTGRGRALATVICVAVASLALIAVWARETAEHRPVRLAGGRARMAVDEVAAALREAVVADAGLADAGVHVRNWHRRGLLVAVRADIHPGARIDDTVDTVDRVVKQIVQEQMGVRLAARTAVDVRYRELDLRLGRGT